MFKKFSPNQKRQVSSSYKINKKDKGPHELTYGAAHKLYCFSKWTEQDMSELMEGEIYIIEKAPGRAFHNHIKKEKSHNTNNNVFACPEGPEVNGIMKVSWLG
jgi:hypothetical protein